MPAYKRNHYIPKIILKNWVTQGTRYSKDRGIYVFEISNNKYFYSSAVGKSAFNFAIASNLYVPVLDGKRIVNAEKWLSGLEGAIGLILPMILAGGEINYGSDISLPVKFLMGLLSLEHRSEYILQLYQKNIESDPETQNFLGLHSDRTVHQLIVENIVNSVDEYTHRLLPARMILMQPILSEFIVTDRPVINEKYLGQRIIVVSPRLAIALETGWPAFGYRYQQIDTQLVHSMNNILVTQARSWIAGTSEKIVRQYSAVVGTSYGQFWCPGS